jgi:hypothetical protein
VGAAPAITPVLAERVATTALVVAVALSGFSTSTRGPISGPAAGSTRQGFGWDRSAGTPQLKPQGVEPSDDATTKVAAATVDPVSDLTREIEVVINGHEHFNNEPKKHQDRHSDDPGAEAASTANRLAKKVKDLLPKATKDLGLDL